MFRTSTQVGNLQRELKQCKSQMAEQHKTLVEYSSRMDEYDKKNEETNRKFSTLLQVSDNFSSSLLICEQRVYIVYISIHQSIFLIKILI